MCRQHIPNENPVLSWGSTPVCSLSVDSPSLRKQLCWIVESQLGAQSLERRSDLPAREKFMILSTYINLFSTRLTASSENTHTCLSESLMHETFFYFKPHAGGRAGCRATVLYINHVCRQGATRSCLCFLDEYETVLFTQKLMWRHVFL